MSEIKKTVNILICKLVTDLNITKVNWLKIFNSISENKFYETLVSCTAYRYINKLIKETDCQEFREEIKLYNLNSVLFSIPPMNIDLKIADLGAFAEKIKEIGNQVLADASKEIANIEKKSNQSTEEKTKVKYIKALMTERQLDDLQKTGNQIRKAQKMVKVSV
jgi:hypothetical protein